MQQGGQGVRPVLQEDEVRRLEVGPGDFFQVGFERGRIQGWPGRIARLRRSAQGNENALADEPLADCGNIVGRLRHHRGGASQRMLGELHGGIGDDLAG